MPLTITEIRGHLSVLRHLAARWREEVQEADIIIPVQMLTYAIAATLDRDGERGILVSRDEIRAVQAAVSALTDAALDYLDDDRLAEVRELLRVTRRECRAILLDWRD